MTTPEAGKKASPRHHPTTRTAQGRRPAVAIDYFGKNIRHNKYSLKIKYLHLHQNIQIFSTQLRNLIGRHTVGGGWCEVGIANGDTALFSYSAAVSNRRPANSGQHQKSSNSEQHDHSGLERESSQLISASCRANLPTWSSHVLCCWKCVRPGVNPGKAHRKGKHISDIRWVLTTCLPSLVCLEMFRRALCSLHLLLSYHIMR